MLVLLAVNMAFEIANSVTLRHLKEDIRRIEEKHKKRWKQGAPALTTALPLSLLLPDSAGELSIAPLPKVVFGQLAGAPVQIKTSGTTVSIHVPVGT